MFRTPYAIPAGAVAVAMFVLRPNKKAPSPGCFLGDGVVVYSVRSESTAL